MVCFVCLQLEQALFLCRQEGTMNYPFTAVVGSDSAKKALLLALINPSVGGVLLTGEKGTGKSVLMRALRGLQEAENQMVDLPLHVTRERLLGAERAQEPFWAGRGLLEAARGKQIYIDEINLLPQETAAILAAECSDTLLLGTMNPEEGQIFAGLREQFGLVVFLEGEKRLRERTEIIRRRLEYEKSPVQFCRSYQEQEMALKTRLQEARKHLQKIRVTEYAMTAAAEMVQEAACEGNHTELYLIQTARAIAAWENATSVSNQHLLEAAQYVFPYRGKKPLSEKWKTGGGEPQAQKSEQQAQTPQTEQKIPNEQTTGEPSPVRSSDDTVSGGAAKAEDYGAETAGSPNSSGRQKEEAAETVSEAEAVSLNHWLETDRKLKIRKAKINGRRLAAKTAGSHGHYTRTRQGTPASGSDIALAPTILRAAVHHQGQLPLKIGPQDIQIKVREGKAGYHILFAVDASASMGAADRLKVTRAAVLAMLRESYEKRDRIGLIAFQGDQASVLLEFTNSAELASRRLREFPVQGRTPLAKGLELSYQMLKGTMAKDRGILPVLVLITDGRATSGQQPVEEALQAAGRFAAEPVQCVVIDTEKGRIRLGIAAKIAEAMKGTVYSVDHLQEEELRLIVKSVL